MVRLSDIVGANRRFARRAVRLTTAYCPLPSPC